MMAPEDRAAALTDVLYGWRDDNVPFNEILEVITQAIKDAVEEDRIDVVKARKLTNEIARLEERESCAKVADERYYALDLQEVRGAVSGIAQAIRNRK